MAACEMTDKIDLSLLDPVLSEKRGDRSALIPILQKAQDICGYLPPEVIVHISKKLRIPEPEIFGVITFYAQFYLAKQGRHKVRACRGTACHVRGARAVLKTIESKLGISDGETTEDYNFTLETVACLGACALSPVVVVDQKYYGKMTSKKILTVLEKI